MSWNVEQIAERWTDDYLDLYNFALKIGDQEWQAQILGQLNERQSGIRHEAEQLTRESLWRLFDETNKKLLAIYTLLQCSEDRSDRRKLMEKAMELKLERISVSNKIKQHHLNHR